MKKLIRITTVPISLKVLLKGQLSFMSKHFHVIGVSSSGSELTEVNLNEGIEVVKIDMSRKITLFKDLVSLWEVYLFLKKSKPNLVHTHTPKAGIVGMLAAKFAGVPHRLHTVAGLPLMEATGNKRKLLDFVEKLTYSAATKVYPNSKGLYEFILEHKFTSPNKLKIIGNGSSNGIDTSFFSNEFIKEEQKNKLKGQLDISSEDFVFIFVGRLVGDKGINELVYAFDKIGKTHSELRMRLLLVGLLEEALDPLRYEVLEKIKTNPNVISVGFQEDVRPYFAISDALVFPSYREGFPNVVMQAGAMELPSIVSNINGCNEIVIEGVNGTIIPVKDIDAIYNAMVNFVKDKVYYITLKKNARKMIQERYEQSVVWNALLEEYNNLLND